MRLLDLYCGAGGCSVGYARAGFRVAGIDIDPSPNYPFECLQADVIEYLDGLDVAACGFSAVHASPPCQHYSRLRNLRKQNVYPDLIAPTRELLIATGLPYVIENVDQALPDLIEPVRICGSSLGLNLHRHRWFETNWPLMAPPCQHGWQAQRFRSLDKRQKTLSRVVGVHGHLNYAGEQPIREAAMEIDWMTPQELTQAIPPAYTELIGHQLAQYIRSTPAATTTTRGTTA